MKHKKGLAIFLSIACVAILGGVLLFGKSPEHTFTPEVTESASGNSWEEKSSQADSDHATLKESADETLPADGSAKDPVQTVISEDTEQVITELTPIEDKAQIQADTKPTAPPPDEEKQGRLPECDTPPNTPTSVPESAPEEPPQNPPAESQKPSENVSQGQDGQVYDPVFGWITPSTSQGQVIDNDGDINKQVGTMN